MIAYHRDVPEYQAVLAESLSNDTRTLARLEYHANHPVPGWHVHGSCGAVDDLDLGVTKPNGQKRFPGVHNRHRKGDYSLEGDSMNDNMALEIAAKKFAFPFTKDLLGSVAP